MTAHKHAEIGIAKLKDTNLVLFGKHEQSSEWSEIVYCGDVSLLCEYEYFLCHPKHAKECSHWLNGGGVEFLYTFGFGYFDPIIKWHANHHFMLDNFDFRIKPRKEKRWIGVYDCRFVTQPPRGTLQEVQELVLSSSEYRNCAPEGWQFIEIEVEVK